MVIGLPFLAVLGLLSGVLSGLYGIGGGAIGVPLMIFSGIPADIAIATSLLQIVGISFVNVVRNIPSKNINYKIATRIAIFSSVGSIAGVSISNALRSSQYFTPVISLMYMGLLCCMACVMLVDVVFSYFLGEERQSNPSEKAKLAIHEEDGEWQEKVKGFEDFLSQRGIKVKYTHILIYKKICQEKRRLWVKFGFIGTFIGILSGIMGIGGGFISIPAIVYLLREPLIVASMTSSLIALLTTIPACIFQLHSTSLVEPFIAIISGIFAAFGVRIGNGIGQILPQRLLKLIFACILIMICIRFGIGVFSSSFTQYNVSIL